MFAANSLQAMPPGRGGFNGRNRRPLELRSAHHRPPTQIELAPVERDTTPLRPLGTFGREAWDYVLATTSWMAACDLLVVQRYAEQVDEYQQLRIKALREDDHQARKALRTLEALMTVTEQMLAIGPASRSRVGAAVVQPQLELGDAQVIDIAGSS